MNSLHLTGRLVRDPERTTLPSGDSVTTLRLAVDGMAPRRETGYIDVSTYGKPAEAAARILTKGWLVAVTGRLEHRTWTTDSGQNRHAYQAVGQVEFLAAPKTDRHQSSDDDAAADAAIAAARDVDDIPF